MIGTISSFYTNGAFKTQESQLKKIIRTVIIQCDWLQNKYHKSVAFLLARQNNQLENTFEKNDSFNNKNGKIYGNKFTKNSAGPI